jgi:hypothetical protein
MVKIEAKLDAEFGEGQLNSYIRDLRSNSSNGLVLVLVPRRRDDVIAEDIIQTVSPEFALTGDGPWRLNKTPDCSIAVIYWEEVLEALGRALSEQNSKYLERPSNRSDRPGKMQENQWPRNPVLTFWQSKRICSDNAAWTVLRPNGVMESAQ